VEGEGARQADRRAAQPASADPAGRRWRSGPGADRGRAGAGPRPRRGAARSAAQGAPGWASTSAARVWRTVMVSAFTSADGVSLSMPPRRGLPPLITTGVGPSLSAGSPSSTSVAARAARAFPNGEEGSHPTGPGAWGRPWRAQRPRHPVTQSDESGCARKLRMNLRLSSGHAGSWSSGLCRGAVAVRAPPAWSQHEPPLWRPIGRGPPRPFAAYRHLQPAPRPEACRRPRRAGPAGRRLLRDELPWADHLGERPLLPDLGLSARRGHWPAPPGPGRSDLGGQRGLWRVLGGPPAGRSAHR
jgi:hypothetical protein